MSTASPRKNWRRVKFGEVVRNVNDNVRDPKLANIERVVGLEHIDPNSLMLRRWDELVNMTDGTTFTRRFAPGQVMFGKRRAYQRKVAVPQFSGVCSGDILVFEALQYTMLQTYLPYVVQSDAFFAHALGTSAGSLSPRTKWADIAKFEFDLPPIEEQQLIVDLMTAVDAHIESLIHQVEVTRATRDSVLNELMTASSDDWTHTTLGEVASVIMGRQLSPDKRHGTRPRKYLRAANVSVDGIDVLDLLEMDFTEDEEKRFACELGDILLVEGGNEKSVGCPGLVDEASAGLCIQNTLIRCRIKDLSRVRPEFLFHLLKNHFFRGDFSEIANGTTIMHLGQRRAEIFELTLPSLQTQDAAIAVVQGVYSSLDQTAELLRDVRTLRRALLNSEIG
jgi:type I restriction enzyme S subunit